MLADYSCDWHEANDAEPDFAHYDAYHDSDGDGIGCELITGLPAVPETTITLVELDETGSFIEESTTPDPTPVPDAPAAAVPSVLLLVNSNFRQGPGLQYVIVGGGAADSIYQWTSAAYGNGGWIWYELVLPGGPGWVRGDLIRLLDAPESTPFPTDSV